MYSDETNTWWTKRPGIVTILFVYRLTLEESPQLQLILRTFSVNGERAPIPGFRVDLFPVSLVLLSPWSLCWPKNRDSLVTKPSYNIPSHAFVTLHNNVTGHGARLLRGEALNYKIAQNGCYGWPITVISWAPLVSRDWFLVMFLLLEVAITFDTHGWNKCQKVELIQMQKLT